MTMSVTAAAVTGANNPKGDNMVRVISDGDAWIVIVDDVIRARCADLFEATAWARKWGW